MIKRLFFRPQPLMDSSLPVYLVIGLGNPGREYRNNRHNVGFMVIDAVSKALDININRVQFKAMLGSGVYGEKRVILAKPQTFMNLSGQSVSQLVNYYKISLQNLLIVHDDIDIQLGTLRMRPNGGSGGQKGLASIIQQLGTQEFGRLRVGIGRPPGRMDPADYVLQNIPDEDRQVLTIVFDRASQAIQTFIRFGLNQAMNENNGAVTE
jgi:PTH1 family peptidyl-tRNA hydrolase